MAKAAESVKGLLQKLDYRNARIRKNRIRTPLRNRRRPATVRTLTPLQKAQNQLEWKEKAQDLKADLDEIYERNCQSSRELAAKYGKTAEHWFRTIMQDARTAKSRRKVSRYNAYVSMRMEEENGALSDGETRHKANDKELQQRISQEWRGFTEQEKKDITKDRVAELEARRESADIGRHNTRISAFHDTRATLAHVVEQLDFLNKRAGIEVVLFASRGESTEFSHPLAWVTSDRGNNFCQDTLNTNPVDMATRLEAYLLAGIKGALVSPKRLNKMHYADFEEYLTRRHHIVVCGWPVEKFQSPYSITSLTELRGLRDRLKTGATYFKKLTDDEYEQWSQARFNQALALTQAQTATPEDGASPAADTSLSGASNAPTSGTSNRTNTEPIGPTSSVPPTSPALLPTSPSSPSTGMSSSSSTSPSSSSLTSSPSSSNPSPPLSTSTSPSPPANPMFNRGTKRPAETVFTVDGIVAKKPRKVRSDKGKPRGKRAKGNAQAQSSSLS
ncbi:hypothetical protein K474DRAFT_1745859 [Panus rudis PR-1116 ss-1]|nr:hypothetical protein K474DRAFT_1745859 [Panus rudis PR-1116 ss-1]